MDPLTRQAEDVLDAYRDARQPKPGDDAGAWDRLRRGMRQEDATVAAAEQGLRRRRRRRRLAWRAIRPAVLAMFAVSVALVAARYSNHMGETALLNDVEMLMEQQEYGQAYAKLVEHSRRFGTRGAAERRMGLVVDCLCAVQKPQRAREELERYLDLNPASVHADRIADVCPGMEVPEPPDPTERFPTPRLRDKSLTVELPPKIEVVAPQANE